MPDGPDSGATVLRYGHPTLRRRCRDVTADEDVSQLAAAMIAAMAAESGVGLAAPQIGDPRRVIVAVDPTTKRSKPLVMINPVVERLAGPREEFEEGCLSFPDLYFKLRRPRQATVRYRGLDGAMHTLRDEGVLARIVQHEIDHLDGVLFIDHLPRWRRWLLSWRLRRLRIGEDAA